MLIKTHNKNTLQIAELISDSILISTAEEGKQLLVDLYYQGFELVIIQSGQLNPSFFELKSGLAGDILQTCSNFRMRLAITGNFAEITSKSLHDFIYESNKGKMVNFVDSVKTAIERA